MINEFGIKHSSIVLFLLKKKKKSSNRHVLVMIIEFECQVVNDPNILANNFSRNLYFLYKKGRKGGQTFAHTRHVRPHMHIYTYTYKLLHRERGISAYLTICLHYAFPVSMENYNIFSCHFFQYSLLSFS